MESVDVDNLRHEMDNALKKLVITDDDTTHRDMDIFRRLYLQFLTEPPTVDWSTIEPIPDRICRSYNQLSDVEPNETGDLLRQLVVIKLNGGLGTSMGCRGPKSLIAVRDGKTFLSLAIDQINQLNRQYDSSVPLVLMNSYMTDAATKRVLNRKCTGGGNNENQLVETFMQSRCPRIDRDSLMPVAEHGHDRSDDGWYPPGHGNIFESMHNTGLLDRLIADGRHYCFVSNIDNTGAMVDLRILKFMQSDGADYLMEVTEKTPMDVKGGTLVQIGGRIMHLEMPQVPHEFVEDFKSIRRFRIFNTNNIWIDLRCVKRLLLTTGITMEIIVNPKTSNSGESLLQLETSIGGAIRNFDRVFSLDVPRHRFLPVKKTQDMLAIMSNLYRLNDGVLKPNPDRPIISIPIIKLSSPHFDKVADFLKRFRSIPDLLHLTHLTVVGDVTFGAHITLKGTVVIVADHGHSLTIPDNTIIDNKIVCGRLRFLEH